LLMDFEMAPVAGTVAILERGAGAAHVQDDQRPDAGGAAGPEGESFVDAQALYEHALALEPSDPAAAESAYLQALAVAPELEEAYLNLGTMLDASERYADLLRL